MIENYIHVNKNAPVPYISAVSLLKYNYIKRSLVIG
jgi:hypothetical protein